MALLGGMQRLWGQQSLASCRLIVLSELLQLHYPYWFSILLGLVFMVIIYVLPRGVTGLVEDAWVCFGRLISLPGGRRLALALPTGIVAARHRWHRGRHLDAPRGPRLSKQKSS